MQPSLRIAYTLSIAGVVGVVVAAALIFRSRLGASGRWLILGATVFLCSQLVRLFVLLLLGFVRNDPQIWLVVCATSSGLFEEVGRYLGYKYLVPDARSWLSGVGYGLGHGGMEALVTAVLMGTAFYTLEAYGRLDTSIVKFGPQQLADIKAAQSWWFPIAGFVERLSALPVHIALSLVVLWAIVSRTNAWVGIAIVSHGAVNLVSGLLLKRLGIAYSEIFMVLSAIFALYVIIRFKRIDSPEETG